jgi:2-keto-4-pentenoate hydratase/2-oxohepta-3-ene-1,7-dioic acid hydratase in catechol pathway
MKIARYRIDGIDSLGLVTSGIISLTRHLSDAPRDMIQFVAAWDQFAPRLTDLESLSPDHALSDVQLLAPIARPGKILGIGLNYADHVAESGMDTPIDQLWFSKPATSVTGPYEPVRVPRVSEQLDYEAELVVVIGRQCRYASRDEAEAAIFGYCVGNDFSVRDWQFRTSQFMLGKSFDSHAPHGPWIQSKDAIDPKDLDITCKVNGEVRQNSNTRHLIFDPVAQIEYLSQVMTLEPGDLLFTGTPGGVGAAHTPPTWLKAGDIVRTEIEGIGAIENQIVAD